ncbi:hypothetical protein [Salmonirosea aquatica]|uniref:Uncharacterized protein n=1 Tax=Salmonirosea aquatica TaxID=2654236 RepID=A0A7C9BM84_9BACT|nr:hypothetical protein [Cytophagaceae bacterium SJW1-29]
MALLKSKFSIGLHNLTVEEAELATIRLSPPYPAKPNVWVLSFYGTDGQVVRTWYYDSEKKRKLDLDQVLKRCPRLKVE